VWLGSEYRSPDRQPHDKPIWGTKRADATGSASPSSTHVSTSPVREMRETKLPLKLD
jgi:hypothetical protein